MLKPQRMCVSLLLRQGVKDTPFGCASKQITAGMATTTRTLEGCQQERATGDVAGKPTEVVGGDEDSSEQC